MEDHKPVWFSPRCSRFRQPYRFRALTFAMVLICASVAASPSRQASPPASPKALLQAAQAALQQGNMAEGEWLLREALRHDPRLAEAHFQLGLVLSSRNDLLAAAEELVAATELEPQRSQYQLALGMVYGQVGNMAEALRVFQHALQLDPGQPNVARMAAEILRSQLKGAEALSMLEKTYAHVPEWELGVALAESYVVESRRPDAVSLLRKLLARRPDSAQVMRALGELLVEESATSAEGARLLRRAVEREPESAEARFALGKYLLPQREAGEAVKHLQEALRLKPDESRFRYMLAMALTKAGSEEEGQRQMEQFRQQSKGEEQRRERQGRFHRAYQRAQREAARGHLVSARQSLEEALAADPHPAAYALLADVLHGMHQYREGAAAIEEALRLEPGNGNHHYLRGSFRVRAKQWEGALADLRTAAALIPSHADTYNQQGNALAGLGRWDEAIAAYRRAIELDPAQAGYLLNLSIALKAAGRQSESDEARARYEQRQQQR